MGLATPTAVAVGTGRAAETGILVRNAAALESAGQVDTVVFDKTGTLTLGRPVIEAIEVVEGFDEREVIDLAGAAERGSEHPYGRAIVVRANRDELGFHEAQAFEAIPGEGVTATVEGRRVIVGTKRLLARQGIEIAEASATATGRSVPGRTPVHVAIDGRHAATFYVSDPVRPTASIAVRELVGMGLDVWLVSGDHQPTVDAVARPGRHSARPCGRRATPRGQGTFRRAVAGRRTARRDGR